jgi:hypothetical protein
MKWAASHMNYKVNYPMTSVVAWGDNPITMTKRSLLCVSLDHYHYYKVTDNFKVIERFDSFREARRSFLLEQL